MSESKKEPLWGLMLVQGLMFLMIGPMNLSDGTTFGIIVGCAAILVAILIGYRVWKMGPKWEG